VGTGVVGTTIVGITVAGSQVVVLGRLVSSLSIFGLRALLLGFGIHTNGSILLFPLDSRPA